MPQRKKKTLSYKRFFRLFFIIIKISSILATSNLMHYLYFGAFDLMAQESFGQLVAGPVNVTATRGHLRAGIKQQGCTDI